MKNALLNQPIIPFQSAPDVVLRGPPITIPLLAGQTTKAAAAALTALGLTPAVVPTTVQSSEPLGTVDSTDPTAGTTVYAGQIVKLTISSGIPIPVSPPPVSIPPGSQPPGSQIPGSPAPGSTSTPTSTASVTPTPTPAGH
jgi:biofilm PGA synthesis protein PgaA